MLKKNVENEMNFGEILYFPSVLQRYQHVAIRLLLNISLGKILLVLNTFRNIRSWTGSDIRNSATISSTRSQTKTNSGIVFIDSEQFMILKGTYYYSAEVGNFYFDNSEAINVSKFHGFGVLSELSNKITLHFSS